MVKAAPKISKNIKDTEKIAEAFLRELAEKKHAKAAVVGLYGDLGAGKTAFVKHAAKLLGVTRKVSSPTFVIMKKYPLKGKAHKTLFHIDAYRLKNEKEIEILGWKDIISSKENLIFIEWPERVQKAMPKGHSRIAIAHAKDGGRVFKVKI
ncbi:MAG: tRNA (adenosine(37)-N6)-threonylcarbamoyltransferase complex ATPase subunit type 1 TsaE [bacterium]